MIFNCYFYSFKRIGNFIYIANGFGFGWVFLVYDVSDPENIFFVEGMPTGIYGNGVGVDGAGNTLFVTDSNRHVTSFDITDHANMFENIFVIGDAGNFPTSKAGSVVHFEADILYENLLCYIEDRPFTASFDGHSNCYIETGHGKGALIDFNYDTEPLPGSFPFPGIGPFGLLKETRMNHYGKLMFRWIYWHILLKGKEMPIDTQMTMAGKKME